MRQNELTSNDLLADKNRTLRLGLWICLAGLFTAVMISHSLRHGRLLVDPYYDDANYFADALSRIHILDNSGPFVMLKDFVHRPPHSLAFTLLAMVCYLVLGPHFWAPYVGTGLLVLALLLVVDYCTAGLHLLQRIGVALFVLAVPLAGVCVEEFRPDCAAGLATVVAVLLLLEEPVQYTTTRRRLVIGALLGGALLIKSTVFPFTLLLAAVSYLVSIAVGWVGREISLRQVFAWRTWGEIALPVVILALPYYLLAASDLWAYIHTHVYGGYKDVWQVPGSWVVQLRYFFDGPAGRMMLGRHVWLLLLLAAVGLMACVYHPQRRQMAKALALGVVLLVALLFPVLNKTKNHFFGVGFHLLLLIIGVLVLRWIFLGGKSGRSRVRAAIGWGIIVISIGLASWPLSLVRFAPSSPEISAIRRVQQGVYGTIRANMAGENSLVYYTCAGYVDGAGLRCRALLDGYDIGVNIEYLSTDLRQHQAAMEAADFVVAGEEGSDLMHPWLPSSTAQDQTLALLRRLPNFREIGAFAALHDKKIHVFQRLVSPVPDKLPAN